MRTGGGSGGEWVELVRARDDIDAHLLVGRLDEAGVATRTVKDRHAPGAWLYGGSNPWAPVLVLVRRLQLDEARLVLARISFDEPAVTRRGPVMDDHAGALRGVAALALGFVVTATTVAQVAGRLADG